MHLINHVSWFGGGPEPRRKGRRWDRDREEKRDKGRREEWGRDRKEGNRGQLSLLVSFN